MALRPLFLLPLAVLCAASALADDFDAKVGAGLRLVGDHGRRDHDRWGDHGRRDRDDRRLERERRERWRDYDRPQPPRPAPSEPSPREYEPREPRNREVPNQPAPRRGRWDQGYGLTIHPWRPAHFASYLGYAFDIQECVAFGREAGYSYVVRYDFSGDCYGDNAPY